VVERAESNRLPHPSRELFESLCDALSGIDLDNSMSVPSTPAAWSSCRAPWGRSAGGGRPRRATTLTRMAVRQQAVPLTPLWFAYRLLAQITLDPYRFYLAAVPRQAGDYEVET
jgi:hypothetical protein